jgi:hypothetical protein
MGRKKKAKLAAGFLLPVMAAGAVVHRQAQHEHCGCGDACAEMDGGKKVPKVLRSHGGCGLVGCFNEHGQEGYADAVEAKQDLERLERGAGRVLERLEAGARSFTERACSHESRTR